MSDYHQSYVRASLRGDDDQARYYWELSQVEQRNRQHQRTVEALERDQLDAARRQARALENQARVAGQQAAWSRLQELEQARAAREALAAQADAALALQEELAERVIEQEQERTELLRQMAEAQSLEFERRAELDARKEAREEEERAAAREAERERQAALDEERARHRQRELEARCPFYFASRQWFWHLQRDECRRQGAALEAFASALQAFVEQPAPRATVIVPSHLPAPHEISAAALQRWQAELAELVAAHDAEVFGPERTTAAGASRVVIDDPRYRQQIARQRALKFEGRWLDPEALAAELTARQQTWRDFDAAVDACRSGLPALAQAYAEAVGRLSAESDWLRRYDELREAIVAGLRAARADGAVERIVFGLPRHPDGFMIDPVPVEDFVSFEVCIAESLRIAPAASHHPYPGLGPVPLDGALLAGLAAEHLDKGARKALFSGALDTTDRIAQLLSTGRFGPMVARPADELARLAAQPPDERVLHSALLARLHEDPFDAGAERLRRFQWLSERDGLHLRVTVGALVACELAHSGYAALVDTLFAADRPTPSATPTHHAGFVAGRWRLDGSPVGPLPVEVPPRQDRAELQASPAPAPTPTPTRVTMTAPDMPASPAPAPRRRAWLAVLLATAVAIGLGAWLLLARHPGNAPAADAAATWASGILPGGWVTDPAGALSPEARARLSSALARLGEGRGWQARILVVPETGQAAIDQAGLAVARHWATVRGIDMQLLILVATSSRKIRLEVGRPLAADIPDAVADELIQRSFVPSARAGGIEAGLLSLVQDLQRRHDAAGRSP